MTANRFSVRIAQRVTTLYLLYPSAGRTQDGSGTCGVPVGWSSLPKRPTLGPLRRRHRNYTSLRIHLPRSPLPRGVSAPRRSGTGFAHHERSTPERQEPGGVGPAQLCLGSVGPVISAWELGPATCATTRLGSRPRSAAVFCGPGDGI